MLDLRKSRALPALFIVLPFVSSCRSNNTTTGESAKPDQSARPSPSASSTGPGKATATASAASSGNDQNCTADAAWIKTPSQPDGSQFNPTSNCTFHQWTYQTFLWLVSKDPASTSGALVFEGFANPKDLFKPGGPDAPYPGRAANQGLTFHARMAKSQTTVNIDTIFQAGPGNKALIDQGGNIVYYANHLDKQYWDFAVKHKLFDVKVLQHLDPKLDFPVDALELKTSWRIAEIEGKEPIIKDAEKRFFVIRTEVPTVTANAKGILQEDPSKPIKAKMALVGMHVTGVVKNHPEFIWGTFEHAENAPNCADIPPANVQGKVWNFYNGKASTATTNQFNVGNPLAVVNVCLVHPFGGGTDGSANPDDNNQNAIKTLNANVAALEGNSIWTNYFLGGAVWTKTNSSTAPSPVPINNGAFSPSDLNNGATQVGSIDLANTSMETFTQNDNCFACHNGGAHEVAAGDQSTEVNAKNVNLSHFVVNYQATQQVSRK